MARRPIAGIVRTVRTVRTARIVSLARGEAKHGRFANIRLRCRAMNTIRRIITMRFLAGLSACGGESSRPTPADWPQWRGPDGNGISDATGLAVPLGCLDQRADGVFRSPGRGLRPRSLWGDRIFLTTAEGDDLVLMAISTDGKEIWKRRSRRG